MYIFSHFLNDIVVSASIFFINGSCSIRYNIKRNLILSYPKSSGKYIFPGNKSFSGSPEKLCHLFTISYSVTAFPVRMLS